MAEENPRDKRRRPRRVGRPKEEGGHHRINISVSEFMSEALKKVPNKSKFLRELALPVLKEMDPGDASMYIWQIDVFISQGIIEAAKEKDFKKVNALSWLANQLEVARKLSDVPSLEMKPQKIQGASREYYSSLVSGFWRESEAAQRLRLCGRLFLAWEKTKRFSEKLPKKHEGTKQLFANIKKTDERLEEIERTLFPEHAQRALLYDAIPQIWEQIASVLSMTT